MVVMAMKEIIIIVLVMLLFIAIFYLLLLKRAIRKFNKNLEKKLKNNSNIILTTDFTDKDLNNLIDHINATLIKYNNIKNEYENKNKNLQRMMTNISHDLRTPLTSALGYIDMIQKNNLSKEEQTKNLKIIEERLKRLTELINSFFEFSKIISNNENIKLEKLNLVAVLEKTISNHYEDFSRENRIINFHTAKRKIFVNSNEMMLERIFDNLIRNAYKHSNNNLDINLYIDKNIVISFSNELLNNNLDVEKIFDEFYTVDISRTKGNTGLGLAIAKEFVEQLQGKIRSDKNNNKLIITITF